jgi:hypothetical protein
MSAAIRRPRNPTSGAIRASGVVAALVTAAAVFGVGMLVLPPPVEPPAPVALPPPPPPPPVAAPEAGASDASDDGQADTTTDVKLEVEPPTEPKPEPKPEPRAASTPEPKPAVAPPIPTTAAKGEPHERPADKDVARDAWRKNLPDVTTEPGRASMLIPIKGSIEGATYHVTVKPRSVLVTLPKAESMITMPFYSVRHDGFRQLWIKKDEASGATTMRIVLGDATDPQAEIKDDFVRVTVKRLEGAPAPSPASSPPTTPKPAEAAPPRD